MIISAKYSGTCDACGDRIQKRDVIWWERGGDTLCAACAGIPKNAKKLASSGGGNCAVCGRDVDYAAEFKVGDDLICGEDCLLAYGHPEEIAEEEEGEKEAPDNDGPLPHKGGCPGCAGSPAEAPIPGGKCDVCGGGFSERAWKAELALAGLPAGVVK